MIDEELRRRLALEPTGRSFRVPTVAVFSFEGDRIVNERAYLDLLTLLRQIGRTELASLAAP